MDQILACDEEIHRIDAVDVRKPMGYVCLVYVNGALIGYTKLTII